MHKKQKQQIKNSLKRYNYAMTIQLDRIDVSPSNHLILIGG